jgi:hypothetical protein
MIQLFTLKILNFQASDRSSFEFMGINSIPILEIKLDLFVGKGNDTAKQ